MNIEPYKKEMKHCNCVTKERELLDEKQVEFTK